MQIRQINSAAGGRRPPLDKYSTESIRACLCDSWTPDNFWRPAWPSPAYRPVEMIRDLPRPFSSVMRRFVPTRSESARNLLAIAVHESIGSRMSNADIQPLVTSGYMRSRFAHKLHHYSEIRWDIEKSKQKNLCTGDVMGHKFPVLLLLCAITFYYYYYIFHYGMDHWSDTSKWLIDWLIDDRLIRSSSVLNLIFLVENKGVGVPGKSSHLQTDLKQWLQLRSDCNSTALRPFDDLLYDYVEL